MENIQLEKIENALNKKFECVLKNEPTFWEVVDNISNTNKKSLISFFIGNNPKKYRRENFFYKLNTESFYLNKREILNILFLIGAFRTYRLVKSNCCFSILLECGNFKKIFTFFTTMREAKILLKIFNNIKKQHAIKDEVFFGVKKKTLKQNNKLCYKIA